MPWFTGDASSTAQWADGLFFLGCFGDSWDQARFESCGHKWADVSEGGYGVSILNDCKYGHSVKESELSLTLIKSGIEPNPNTDNEEHVFTYSLYPHAGGWKEGGTQAEAIRLNQPMTAVAGGQAGNAFSFVSADHDNVILETVKAAENGDGVILRVIEEQNKRTNVTLTLGHEVSSAEDCDLMENKTGEVDVKGHTLSFTIRPYEIKTIRVRF